VTRYPTPGMTGRWAVAVTLGSILLLLWGAPVAPGAVLAEESGDQDVENSLEILEQETPELQDDEGDSVDEASTPSQNLRDAEVPSIGSPYVVEWLEASIPAEMAAGAEYRARVTLRNGSSITWPTHRTGPGPAHDVAVSYHWFGESGGAVWDGERTSLPGDVAPGETVTIDDVFITAPREPGAYRLQLTLVRERVGWFEQNGANPVDVSVNVVPAPGFLQDSSPAPTGSLAALTGDQERLRIGGLLAASAVVVVGIVLTKRRRPRLGNRLSAAGALVSVIVALFLVLSAPLEPLSRQPFPDAYEYSDAARNMATGKGYVTHVHGDHTTPAPPFHPPGMSIALVPFSLLGFDYPANGQVGVKVLAAIYVLVTVGVAWLYGGPVAAFLTASITAISPFARISSAIIMADATAATLTVVSVATLHRLSTYRAGIAGLLAGLVTAVRLNGVLNLFALLLVLPMRLRMWAVVLIVPPAVALALFQWSTFGSPLRTGHHFWAPYMVAEPFDLSFALAAPPKFSEPWLLRDVLEGKLLEAACPCPNGGSQAALPNVLFYVTVLLGGFWVYAPPLATVPGFIYVWRHRREPGPGFTLWLTALTYVFYLFYYYQSARYIAAPAALLVIFSSVGLAEWVHRGLVWRPQVQPTTDDLAFARRAA
jgi:hypothetical protein